jgi:DNA-binding transcriptional ArsR family regulator
MSLAAISKHLKVLEGARLISRGKEAQWRPCHLEGAPLHSVAEWLEDYRGFWDRSLESLAEYLQLMERPVQAIRATAKRPRKRRSKHGRHERSAR